MAEQAILEEADDVVGGLAAPDCGHVVIEADDGKSFDRNASFLQRFLHLLRLDGWDYEVLLVYRSTSVDIIKRNAAGWAVAVRSTFHS